MPEIKYISPLSADIGANLEIKYQPLESAQNVSISLDKQDGSSVQPMFIWELLAIHIDNKMKLPVEIREVLLQVLNPQESISKRLELPFTREFVHGNLGAIEIYWGQNRFVCFDDPSVQDLYRCVAIPYDASDPEMYIKSIS